MTDLPVYVLERDFSAPPELVWRTFTEKDLLSVWYGPGVETVIHELDVREGGTWLNEMKMGENSYYQRADYTEVAEPDRLIWLHSVTDGDWNIIDNPMMPGWPRVLLTTVTFTATEGGTRMKLLWEPHEASEAEIETFRGAMAGMGSGWGKGMDLLAEVLEGLQG